MRFQWIHLHEAEFPPFASSNIRYIIRMPCRGKLCTHNQGLDSKRKRTVSAITGRHCYEKAESEYRKVNPTRTNAARGIRFVIASAWTILGILILFDSFLDCFLRGPRIHQKKSPSLCVRAGIRISHGPALLMEVRLV